MRLRAWWTHLSVTRERHRDSHLWFGDALQRPELLSKRSEARLVQLQESCACGLWFWCLTAGSDLFINGTASGEASQAAPPVRAGVAAASARAPSGVAWPASLLAPASDMCTSSARVLCTSSAVCGVARRSALAPSPPVSPRAAFLAGVPPPPARSAGCCVPSLAAAGPSVVVGSPASSSVSSPPGQSSSGLISGCSRSPSAATSSALS